MTHGSLFAGIGGIDLAASWLGWTNVFQVELDPYCRRVLARHFPETHRHDDIKTFDPTPYAGCIDVLSGGFPCQPFSTNGKRKGANDSRHLWPEMLRIIGVIRPRWVLGENVEGFVGPALERACLDLEEIGYRVEPHVIPAEAVGAPHRRTRLWLLAHADGTGRSRSGRYLPRNGSAERPTGIDHVQAPGRIRHRLDPDARPWLRNMPTPALPVLRGVADGFSGGVDRDRLTALGNAVVPQVAYHILSSLIDCIRESS